jgi:hypothetical protein
VSTLLFVVSGLFGIAAYAFYAWDSVSSKTQPNRWVWMTFGITSVLEALTYDRVTDDPVKAALFYISAGCCVVVATMIWGKAGWLKPTWTEFFCLAASTTAVILWTIYDKAGWAHAVMVIAVPVAFIPSYIEAYEDHKREETLAWMLWTFGDLFAILLIAFRFEKGGEMPYAAVEFASHAAMWLMVTLGRRKALSLRT